MAELAAGYLTDVRGIAVGHAADPVALTGCTVVLCGEGAVAGGAVRGLAPGTRETDLLASGTLVERVQAVLLTGGSAFGLAAADGVMRWLEERGLGYDAGVARVPIVPGAVIFDLGVGDARVRPDAAMGYAACEAAGTEEAAQGNVGAGMGATVGKVLGMERAMKAGLGSASLSVGRLVVAALVVCNAFGDVLGEDGRPTVGARAPHGGLLNTAEAIRGPLLRGAMSLAHTVIGVVATNARLDAAQANHLASAAHDGLARAVRPAHTLYDGDTLFALAMGDVPGHPVLLADMAAEAVARAVRNAVWAAEDAGGLPSARSFWAAR